MTYDERMRKLDALLESHHWTLECWSPLEIRHKDGSFATKVAAEMVIELIENGWYEEHCDE